MSSSESPLEAAWEHYNLRQRYEVADDGCWNFRGYRNSDGYGILDKQIAGQRVRCRAHRVFYVIAKGPIPEGLVLDHLCENKGCVNPDHLDPCGRGENVRRHFEKNVTHCPQGHEYTPENTYRGRGGRRCNECHRQQERARRRERIAA